MYTSQKMNPNKIYQGKPCAKCGNTFRYRTTRNLTCAHRCSELAIKAQKKYEKSEKGRKTRRKYEESIRKKRWANDEAWRIKKKIRETKYIARKQLKRSQERSILYDN